MTPPPRLRIRAFDSPRPAPDDEDAATVIHAGARHPLIAGIAGFRRNPFLSGSTNARAMLTALRDTLAETGSDGTLALRGRMLVLTMAETAGLCADPDPWNRRRDFASERASRILDATDDPDEAASRTLADLAVVRHRAVAGLEAAGLRLGDAARTADKLLRLAADEHCRLPEDPDTGRPVRLPPAWPGRLAAAADPATAASPAVRKTLALDHLAAGLLRREPDLTTEIGTGIEILARSLDWRETEPTERIGIVRRALASLTPDIRPARTATDEGVIVIVAQSVPEGIVVSGMLEIGRQLRALRDQAARARSAETPTPRGTPLAPPSAAWLRKAIDRVEERLDRLRPVSQAVGIGVSGFYDGSNLTAQQFARIDRHTSVLAIATRAGPGLDLIVDEARRQGRRILNAEAWRVLDTPPAAVQTAGAPPSRRRYAVELDVNGQPWQPVPGDLVLVHGRGYRGRNCPEGPFGAQHLHAIARDAMLDRTGSVYVFDTVHAADIEARLPGLRRDFPTCHLIREADDTGRLAQVIDRRGRPVDLDAAVAMARPHARSGQDLQAEDDLARIGHFRTGDPNGRAVLRHLLDDGGRLAAGIDRPIADLRAMPDDRLVSLLGPRSAAQLKDDGALRAAARTAGLLDPGHAPPSRGPFGEGHLYGAPPPPGPIHAILGSARFLPRLPCAVTADDIAARARAAGATLLLRIDGGADDAPERSSAADRLALDLIPAAIRAGTPVVAISGLPPGRLAASRQPTVAQLGSLLRAAIAEGSATMMIPSEVGERMPPERIAARLGRHADLLLVDSLGHTDRAALALAPAIERGLPIAVLAPDVEGRGAGPAVAPDHVRLHAPALLSLLRPSGLMIPHAGRAFSEVSGSWANIIRGAAEHPFEHQPIWSTVRDRDSGIAQSGRIGRTVSWTNPARALRDPAELDAFLADPPRRGHRMGADSVQVDALGQPASRPDPAGLNRARLAAWTDASETAPSDPGQALRKAFDPTPQTRLELLARFQERFGVDKVELAPSRPPMRRHAPALSL